MGLPTTVSYIVVSSLMAPVIVMVGAQNGLIVPLVAMHLFVFYFGILADDTPPVGLAAYAAAAISGAIRSHRHSRASAMISEPRCCLSCLFSIPAFC